MNQLYVSQQILNNNSITEIIFLSTINGLLPKIYYKMSLM